jgi:GTPase SAR1 family protein
MTTTKLLCVGDQYIDTGEVLTGNILIGICGESGSGKTTVADYLVNKYFFQEYAFASPLKKIAEVFGFEQKQLYGSQVEKLQVNDQLGISSREFMQKFGTEICREILPKIIPNMDLGESGIIWIKLFEKFLVNLRNTRGCNACVVISDVRFPDEAKSIKNQGGLLIRLTRNIDKSGSEHTHVSETSVDSIECDKHINNNGSKDELYEKMLNIIKDY